MDYLVVRLQQHGKQQTIDALIHQFAELTSAVHQCGVLYKDLNCGNVLCQQTMSMTAWNFTLIDTNRALFSDHPLTLNESLPDIILMNPIMGTVEQFIGEYLLLRGCYSEDEVARIRRLQYLRHERRRPFKEYFKRFKKFYYRWLAR